MGGDGVALAGDQCLPLAVGGGEGAVVGHDLVVRTADDDSLLVRVDVGVVAGATEQEEREQGGKSQTGVAVQVHSISRFSSGADRLSVMCRFVRSRHVVLLTDLITLSFSYLYVNRELIRISSRSLVILLFILLYVGHGRIHVRQLSRLQVLQGQHSDFPSRIQSIEQ